MAAILSATLKRWPRRDAGLIATIMGIQPILTLCVVERRLQGIRLLGQLLALAGLVLLVWRSLAASADGGQRHYFCPCRAAADDLWRHFAKRSRQAPVDVLPLQYLVSLLLCLFMAPVSGFMFTLAQALSSRCCSWPADFGRGSAAALSLLSAGNIVNVTSLFYLVPVITALLDYLMLGNRLPWAAVVGMAAILAELC